MVKPFFETSVGADGEISVRQTAEVQFVENQIALATTFVQRFFRIAGNARLSEQPLKGNEQDIIRQIHAERYQLGKPYIVTGPNFSEFYVRNLGIFFSGMLDGRFALSPEDWEIRQRVALQTLAAHLELLETAGKEFTTFVPLWNNLYTAENWSAEPSDSLYSAYYTLAALTDKQFIRKLFPNNTQTTYQLRTQTAGRQLLDIYRPALAKATNEYLEVITNPDTGLIKQNILLSSARDGIKRQSSFYDNVIAWSTAKLATELGVGITCPQPWRVNQACDFGSWKQAIVAAFWDKSAGIFLDDLSEESKRDHLFSADALIVLQTGFLDLSNPEERDMLIEQISYIQQHNLDKPLPLHYAGRDQPDRLYFFVKYFAPSYMGESIWSHWGMEYIKALVLLAPHNLSYLTDAKNALSAYQAKMERYGGYPELYDKHGNIFQDPLYKSVLRTGWVINYEQAKMLYEAASVKD